MFVRRVLVGCAELSLQSTMPATVIQLDAVRLLIAEGCLERVHCSPGDAFAWNLTLARLECPQVGLEIPGSSWVS